MFIGRKSELEYFNEKYENNDAQLIVLYGRRRVGKTELLREFCKDKPHVFFACKQCDNAEQLRDFSARMLKDNEASRFLNAFQSWEQALEAVLSLKAEGKKLLVIDEFPYMVNGNKSIPSVLQNLWDEKLSRENVMIVLCGSAMSFIEKEVLAEKNPLYGRATGILKMNELSFYDACEFFPDSPAKDKILAYSILGGIPYYLKQFDSKKSIEQNIKNNILRRGCILYNEVEFLMHQELRETGLYNSLVSAIALGATKLNEIHQKTLIEKTKINVYLKNLIEINVLKREFPISDSIKQTANVQRGLYAIEDNYFRFWYRFVYPNNSELEAGDADGVYDYIVKPNLDEFASKAFENICVEYLRRQNRSNQLPFRFSKIGRYWDNKTEIDILAFDATGGNVLVGECKYKGKAFDSGDFDDLKQKHFPHKENANIHYFIFSKGGFTEPVKQDAVCVGVGDLVK